MTIALNNYYVSYENPSCVCAFVKECMKQEVKKHRLTPSPTHTVMYIITRVSQK